jgi:hypothetical protein
LEKKIMEILRLAACSIPRDSVISVTITRRISVLTFSLSNRKTGEICLKNKDLLLLWKQNYITSLALQEIGFKYTDEGWITPHGVEYSNAAIREWLR